MFAEYGFVFFVLGAYLGLALDAKNYKGTVRSVNDTGFMSTVKRLLFAVVPIFALYVLPVFFIPQRTWTIGILISKYGVPCFLTGVLLYGYSKAIY